MAAQIVFAQAVQPPGIQKGNGGAVYDALRTDVHKRAGRHLAVGGYAEGVEAVVILFGGVVGHHHAVGNDYAGCIGM